MRMITRKKLMSKARIVFLSVVVLGGLVLVDANKSPLSPAEGEAWATSLGARGGVGTSAGAGGGTAGAGASAPATGAAGAPARGAGTSAGYGGGAVGAGAGAPARGAAWAPVATPRGYVR